MRQPKSVRFACDALPADVVSPDRALVDKYRQLIINRVLYDGDDAASARGGRRRISYQRIARTHRHLVVQWEWLDDETAEVHSVRDEPGADPLDEPEEPPPEEPPLEE